MMAMLLGMTCAVAWGPRVVETAPPDSGVEAVADLPDDPFRRCAVKALRGDYGTLADWQRQAYEWGLARGLRVPPENRAKVTSYGPWEPCGKYTASGEAVSLRWVSVDPKHVPLGTLIWTPWGLRYAMDTGAAVKVAGQYLREGENQNLDYFTEHEIETQRHVPWLIVKAETEWNWYGRRRWYEWDKYGPCPAEYLP